MAVPTSPDPAADRVTMVRSLLPPGSEELAGQWLDAGHQASGATIAGSAVDHLLAPVVLEPTWPEPTPPLTVGDGAVHADLTEPDRETFATLREVLSAAPPLTAEALAVAAQEWRLPVTPYRTLADATRARRSAPDPASEPSVDGALDKPSAIGAQRRVADQPLVVDLSALWAGPLATSLLAAQGARVVKVDPEVRPDALREHRALYQALNGAKEILDLDLRESADRRHLDQLLSRADLLVDSFSRRVLPNLGYDRTSLTDRFPQLSTLSIVAFGSSRPERDWVSYGPGVHATSGLAQLRPGSGGSGPTGRFRPAPIAYPDALAGLRAYAVGAGVLAAGGRSGQYEVALDVTLEPLVSAVGGGS